MDAEDQVCVCVWEGGAGAHPCCFAVVQPPTRQHPVSAGAVDPSGPLAIHRAGRLLGSHPGSAQPPHATPCFPAAPAPCARGERSPPQHQRSEQAPLRHTAPEPKYDLYAQCRLARVSRHDVHLKGPAGLASLPELIASALPRLVDHQWLQIARVVLKQAGMHRQVRPAP